MVTESDKLNMGAVATLVAVLALALVAIVAILTALVRNEVAREVARKGGTTNTREVRDLVAQQQSELTAEAQWVDRDAGVLSIPVERSKLLVVQDIRRDPELATAAAPDAGVADAGDDAEAAEATEKDPAPPASSAPVPESAASPVTPAPPPATLPTPAPVVSSDAPH